VTQPNLVFVFGDQWRAQAFGYAGDPNVKTPNVDAFAQESVHLPTAVSGWPVCSPYRASLLTGQHPLTHGMVVNDMSIVSHPVSFADALNAASYDTAYVGKWHIDGHGRDSFVPPERRLGFRHWLGYECTHDYNRSSYYGDRPEPGLWEGYDADAQTTAAVAYLRDGRPAGQPFALFLSWGPPHNPYETAPEAFRRLYTPDRISLAPNVPAAAADQARRDLAGYYAHCSALDACFGRLLAALAELRLADDTIVVFTADHGDMLGSQGLWRKQWPYDESIRVPFLLRWPAGLGRVPRTVTAPINSLDVMPTLLSLCGVPIPGTVEGADFAPALRGEHDVDDGGALLACFFPFHECRYATGARDYRGLRTARHTLVRQRQGPTLLFDNRADPWQQRNLADEPVAATVRCDLEAALDHKLARHHDAFEPGWRILRRFSVPLTDSGDDVYHCWEKP